MCERHFDTSDQKAGHPEPLRPDLEVRMKIVLVFAFLWPSSTGELAETLNSAPLWVKKWVQVELEDMGLLERDERPDYSTFNGVIWVCRQRFVHNPFPYPADPLGPKGLPWFPNP